MSVSKLIWSGMAFAIAQFAAVEAASAAALPDLVVTSIATTPAQPQPGDHVVFSATVANKGAGATPNGVTLGVLFSVDGHAVTWSAGDNKSLAPGASVTVQADGGPSGVNFAPLAAGTHTVTAFVDDVNRMQESNKSNNTLTASVTVGTPLPDLVVSAVSASPATPQPGDHVIFTAKVTNQGTAATPAGVIASVAFFVDGLYVSWSIGNTTSIAPGQTVTLSADGGPNGSNYYTAVAGGHTVLATADDVNRIKESNKSNNSLSVPLTVQAAPPVQATLPVQAALPDLVVTSITANPASPQIGDHVVFSAVVKNQGAGPTPANTTIGVAFSVDGGVVSWSAGDSTSLPAGQSVTLTADGGPAGSNFYVAAAGSHALLANVDDVNRMAESNKSNNTLASTLAVAAAATAPAATPSAVPVPIQGLNYQLTFEDTFSDLSKIALTNAPDATKKWFSGNDACCLTTTDGAAANMFPYPAGGVAAPNPYVLLTGGGLGIELIKQAGAWFTGILTTVDSAGQGFAQTYGYFEMQATMPKGPGVWPAFWLLNQGSRTKATSTIGEIDVVEYYGVSAGQWYFSTLHNWSGGGQGLAVGTATGVDQTTGVHAYGMLWDPYQIRFYFDGKIIGAQPTYDVMNEPYFMLINNGIGGGWPTDQTQPGANFQVKSIRAWQSTASSPAPVAPAWIQCAAEGNNCAFAGKRTVRYGQGSSFITITATGGLACNDGTFNDSAPAAGKFCYYSAATVN